MNNLQVSTGTRNLERTASFLDDVKSFKQFGSETICDLQGSIPYFVNEFWTAGQRQSHSIHEISYRACFKAQLPEFFISRLTMPGDVVLDPFMGRGTTPIQANLMGRRAVGNDINPLSLLLTRPRLRSVSPTKIHATLNSLKLPQREIEREDLLAFYHPKTLMRLESLRNWLNKIAPIDADDVPPEIDWIRMVAINRLSGHSPGFFSGRSMPPNQAVSIKAQMKINEKLGQSPPERDVQAIIWKKTRSLLRSGQIQTELNTGLYCNDASNMACIQAKSIALTVTSPPFLDVVNYAADNWLRCWFAGIEADNIKIGMHRSVDAWSVMVADVLAEQARVLKPGGHVAFEVGEVRCGTVRLEQLVWNAAASLPFERIGVVVNDQEFTKTANCWGVDNNKLGTNTNRIVVLKRSSDV